MAPFAVCSMCRKPIQLGAKYWRCSVSTCNSGRIKLMFCSVACWDAHLPTAQSDNSPIHERTTAMTKKLENRTAVITGGNPEQLFAEMFKKS